MSSKHTSTRILCEFYVFIKAKLNALMFYYMFVAANVSHPELRLMFIPILFLLYSIQYRVVFYMFFLHIRSVFLIKYCSSMRVFKVNIDIFQRKKKRIKTSLHGGLWCLP